MPFRQLGPRLGSKLRRRVRRHHAACVDHRRQCPKDDPGDQRRFAGTVTGSNRNADSLCDRQQAVADATEDIALPFVRAVVLGKVSLTPGECNFHKAQRIARTRRNQIEKLPLDLLWLRERHRGSLNRRTGYAAMAVSERVIIALLQRLPAIWIVFRLEQRAAARLVGVDGFDECVVRFT